MTIAETERWRRCPSCGYLVPREADVCKRCIPDVVAPAASPVPDSGPAATPPTAPTAAPIPSPAGAPYGRVMPELLPSGDRGHTMVGSKQLPLIVGGGFILAVLVAFAVGIVGFGSSDSYPTAWDPKLREIATDVARIRGLKFEHPVSVQFLADAKFRRDVGAAGKNTAADRRRADKATQELRALGLVTGKVDLLKSVNAERQSRVLAYYSPERKVIVVRGTDALDIATRVTLAHEMTHALQDQHFDLDALQKRVAADRDSSPDALAAIIEGDANRVEARYLRGLSKPDRAAYLKANEAFANTADSETGSVPAILRAGSEAPYRFGPPAIEVLLADGGNGAVNAVMTRGVFNQKVFLDPTSAIHAKKATHVPAAKLAKGERAVGESTSLGAFDGYQLLSSRLEPSNALSVARGWGGASNRTVRRQGDTCVRLAIRGANARASARIGVAFTEWAATLPPGMAEVAISGGLTTVRSCDPGATSTLTSPDAAIVHGSDVLEVNDGMMAEIVKAGAPPPTARCLVGELLAAPALQAVLAAMDESVDPDAIRDAIENAAPAARAACGLE